MWYAVFNRSMVVLIAGVCTLLCYLAIRMTFISGPFYLLLPLPVFIFIFWDHCEKRIKAPAMVHFSMCLFYCILGIFSFLCFLSFISVDGVYKFLMLVVLTLSCVCIARLYPWKVRWS